ncbi:MAG: hypothetical protein DI592_05280 [Stenotrophomonas maltophilia]|nr:MAG: hypothetical protein DI592_05280 [Stenotrophomonas maltophilia]
MSIPGTKPVRKYIIPLAFLLAFGMPLVCVLVARLFGDLCWPQRIGAIYIGLSVLVQGYIAADQSKVCHELSDGTTLRQHINQTGFTMALFGTLFAALGDLPGSYYGVAMCRG